MTEERRIEYRELSKTISQIHTEVTKVGTRQEDIFVQLKDHKTAIRSLETDVNRTKGAGMAIAGVGGLGLLATWVKDLFR